MEKLQTVVAPHYERFQNEIVPPVLIFWNRLDVPDFQDYRLAAKTCGKDIIKSTKSTWAFLYLTCKPLVILTWIIVQAMWQCSRVVFQLLFEQAWISLKKGGRQLKSASIWFVKFQRSLSTKQILIELGLVGLCVVLYYVRQWLKRQTYVARATEWVREKKHRVSAAYTSTLHKIAKVSRIAALTLPHFVFVAAIGTLRIFCPSFLQWLASDTYATTILSVGYPFVCTLGWIHQDRYNEKWETISTSLNKHKDKTAAAIPNPRRKTPAQQAKEEFATAREKKKGGKAPFTALQASNWLSSGGRATDKAGDNDDDNTISSTSSKTSVGSIASVVTATQGFSQSSSAGTKYWLCYWVYYALIEAFATICSMLPIFGRFVARHPTILSASAELKLCFFIWMFGMEQLLSSSSSHKKGSSSSSKIDALLAQALPMRILHKHVTPMLLKLDSKISQVVSKEKWTAIVHSKANTILSGFVMIRFISEPFKDWILHIIDESRVMVVPCLTLLMPGYITQFGVTYVQYILPSAKSARFVDSYGKEAKRLVYLKYWILHCVLAGLLNWFSNVLWWIPFSSHAIFIAWCHLSFPQTIQQYYPILEMELVAFGLLKGETKLELHETLSARLFSSIVKRLPSAAASTNDIKIGGNTSGDQKNDENGGSGINSDGNNLEATLLTKDESSTSQNTDTGGKLPVDSTLKEEDETDCVIVESKKDK